MSTAPEDDLKEHEEFLTRVTEEVERVIVGQQALLKGMLMGLLANGHVLLEGVPGLAKTLAVSSLAKAVGGTFQRIQFTPDLLPSDLVGTQVYNPKTGDWSVRDGPVFANFVLADEINRAPAKVQSALLEAMQERAVTLGGVTRSLPSPFLVLATQNPLDQEGTYPLPEAQVDRFMFKIVVDYPTREEEKRILERMAPTNTDALPTAQQVVSPDGLVRAGQLLDRIHVDPRIADYIVDLVFATREPKAADLGELAPMIRHGASPRASISLVRASRANAFLERRNHVTPYDVKSVAHAVLRHRIITSFEAEASGLDSEHIVQQILDTVPVP